MNCRQNKKFINFEIIKFNFAEFKGCIYSSLVYKCFLNRLQNFTNILEFRKYNTNEDGKTVFIVINSDITVKWEIQDSNILLSDDNINELCSFIIGNIWINLYNYLIQHWWQINNDLPKRINKIKSKLESFLTANNSKIDNISFVYKDDYSSIIEFIFGIISLSSFNCVSLKLIETICSRKFSSPIIKTLFKGIEYSIETLCIKPTNRYYRFGIFEINEYDEHILSEFNNDYHTHMLYKFLVKSKLINSIKNIELEFTVDIDYVLLFKLLSECKSKFSPESTFCLSYKLSLDSDIYRHITYWYLNQIEKYPSLNYK